MTVWWPTVVIHQRGSYEGWASYCNHHHWCRRFLFCWHQGQQLCDTSKLVLLICSHRTSVHLMACTAFRGLGIFLTSTVLEKRERGKSISNLWQNLCRHANKHSQQPHTISSNSFLTWENCSGRTHRTLMIWKARLDFPATLQIRRFIYNSMEPLGKGSCVLWFFNWCQVQPIALHEVSGKGGDFSRPSPSFCNWPISAMRALQWR